MPLVTVELTAKSIADKADMALIMTKVTQKTLNAVMPVFKQAVNNGTLSPVYLTTTPTHVLDVYKMRRGRYKNVRIWISLNLGTGERRDLFITNADNTPLDCPVDIYGGYYEKAVIEWKSRI